MFCVPSTPTEKTSSDGRTISFGGMYWDPVLDTIEPKVPTCHFGTVFRGRVKVGTEIFSGEMESDMDKFVPQKVTPRQISSKYLSFYDILQLFMPITAGMKRDLRRVMKETDGWDEAISLSFDQSGLKIFGYWRSYEVCGLAELKCLKMQSVRR